MPDEDKWSVEVAWVCGGDGSTDDIQCYLYDENSDEYIILPSDELADWESVDDVPDWVLNHSSNST